MGNKVILSLKKIMDVFRKKLTVFKAELRRKERNKALKAIINDSFSKLSKEEIEKCNSFWSRYPVKYNSDWCRFYKNKTGIFDPRFIPNDVQSADLDPYFNDWEKAKSIDDKNYYSILFSEANQPITVVRIINGHCYSEDYTPISDENALDICKKSQKLIFKQAVESMGGNNIFVWDASKHPIDLLIKYFNTALLKKEYIIQEYLTQSSKLSKIYSGSVNTIRINTLLFENKVYFLAAILKMGAGDMVVDNVHWGGCSCGIDENGKLKKYGSDANGNNIERHPSGFVFEGFEVPGFFEAKELVCKLQKRLGNFRMVGWDIAIDENDKPVLIEVNLIHAAIDFQQWNNGPLYGNLTEKVLDEVYSSKRKK